MADVLRAHFREFANALTQLSNARTQSDRLRAQKRINACTNDMARNKESVSAIVRLLEALPAKTRATKQDLAAYKQLEARLERMTQEKAEADKMIAALRESLAAEQAAHAATKKQYREQLSVANKHVLAIKTQLIQVDRVMQELVAALVKRNHKGATKLLHNAEAEAIKQKIAKAEKHMALIRQSMALAERTTTYRQIRQPTTVAVPSAAATVRPSTAQRRAVHVRTSVSGKTFGPAKQQAEEFVALIQKCMLVADECVLWLVTDNPLFDMSRRAKYLRAVARSMDTGAVLANAAHFSTLVLAGSAAAQMRLHHLAALQTLLRATGDINTVADNLAAARELYALVRDVVEGLSDKHTYQFCFEHEVQASNLMLGFLHTQTKRHLHAQSLIVRYVAMSEPSTPLIDEFLTEDEMAMHQGVSAESLSRATQLTVKDLEPLQACVSIVHGYRDMRVPGDAKPLVSELSADDREPVQNNVASVRLAKHMIDEVTARRPGWAKYSVGVQLLLASVTLDKFAEVRETSTLFLLSFRDTVSYEMAELLAAATTPEQVAGMLTPHSATLPAFDLASYLQAIESSPPAPAQSLWTYSRAELRAMALKDEPIVFRPDWRLVEHLRMSEMTGAQAYISAISAHTEATQAFVGTSILEDMLQAFVFCAPDVGPPAKDNAATTRVAGRESPMARAAALTAALLKDDEMNMPTADIRAARHVVRQLAELDPELLVKVLQNTPAIQTIVDRLSPAVTRDTVAAFLRTHATPLRSAPEQSMVWFRSDACMADGDCGDPTAALTQTLAVGHGALTQVLNVLQIVAYAHTSGHLPEETLRRAKAARKFSGAQAVCESAKQLLNVVSAPLTDSLRLQMVRLQERTRQRMTSQRIGMRHLREHMAQLSATNDDIEMKLLQAWTKSQELTDKLIVANQNLVSSAAAVEACHAQLRNLGQHLDGSKSGTDRMYVHGLMTSIAKQKHAGAVQLLEMTTDEEQRKTLQRTVDELAQEMQAIEAQPSAEQGELRGLKRYLEKEMAMMQAQATELVNTVARVKAEAATAQAEVAALKNARVRCAKQMSSTEQLIVGNLNSRTQLVADATSVASDEERAHLLQELKELRETVGTVTERDRRNVADLDDARRLLQMLDERHAEERASFEARLQAEAEERHALEARLKEQFNDSAKRLAELRLQMADEGSRSRLSDVSVQRAAAATMLHRVSDAILNEVGQLRPLTDVFKVDTTELVTKATTVKNAQIASDADALIQSDNIAEALKLFGQIPQAMAKAPTSDAALAEYDATHKQRVLDLQQRVQQLEAKVGSEQEQAKRYHDIEQYLLERADEESFLASSMHYEYGALNNIGKQALSALDRIRDPDNTPEEVAAAKKDLSTTIVAYQAKYQAILDTIGARVRQHFDNAIANYAQSLKRDKPDAGDAWRQEPMTDKTLPVLNAEARLMLSMQAAWRRARLQQSSGMQDMQQFIKFVLTSLERIVAGGAARLKYYEDLLTSNALAHRVGDISNVERQLAALLVTINESPTMRDQWADVEQLRISAEQQLQQAAGGSGDNDAARIAYVSAAARAAAAGGAVAEAYRLQASVAEMRQQDMQRQQLQVRLDEMQKQRSDAEAELAKVREVMQKREVEQQAALNELKAEHEAALSANRVAAELLTAELQTSARALNDAMAADLYLKAKHRTRAVQLLRDSHMQEFHPSKHAVYVAEANVPEVLNLIDSARAAVRQAFVPTTDQLLSALDVMSAWLVQVQAQDAAITTMMAQQPQDKPQSDDYLDVLASVQTAAPVQLLVLPTVKDLDDVPEETQVVHMYASQLSRMQSTIMAQRASLAAQIAQIADMSAVEEEDKARIGSLEAQLHELQEMMRERAADAESKRQVAESRLDALTKERQALEVQLRTSAKDASDVHENMRKVETELATLRSMRDTYQATLEQNAQLRLQLDALQQQSSMAASREPDLAELRKRRTEIGLQHDATRAKLDALHTQTRMAESQLRAGFTEQQDALLSHDATRLDEYRQGLAAWLKEEMQLIDTEIAARTAQQAMGTAEREQMRRELFDKLALDAETKINEFAESMNAERQSAMDELVDRHDAEVRALRDEHARTQDDLEQQLQILDSLATTLNIDVGASASERNAQIELAVRELQHSLASERIARTQDRVHASTSLNKLLEAQQELQRTSDALRTNQRQMYAEKVDELQQLQQQHAELKSELASAQDQLASWADDNRRQTAELVRYQQQVVQLEQHLKDVQAEVDEQVGINSELRIQLQSLQREREDLQQQVALLTSEQEEREATHAEELAKAANDAFSQQQQMQFMQMYTELEETNKHLVEQNEKLERLVRNKELCDVDTYGYLASQYFQNGLLETIKAPNEDEKNVCWLAKQVAFYEKTTYLFDKYWPLLQSQSPGQRRATWTAMRRLFVDKGIIKPSGQAPPQPCSAYKSPMDCMRSNDRCYFDENNTCVEMPA